MVPYPTPKPAFLWLLIAAAAAAAAADLRAAERQQAVLAADEQPALPMAELGRVAVGV